MQPINKIVRRPELRRLPARVSGQFGTRLDNGNVKRVVVNGQEAKATAGNFAEWEIYVADASTIVAYAEDEAGNVEKLKHEVKLQ